MSGVQANSRRRSHESVSHHGRDAMTAQADPYARVYFSIVDDPRFEGVYDDDATLATWLRLLIVAEGTWPASPPIPRWVKARPFDRLVAAGLLETVKSDRYRIHGLDAERGRRKSQAQNAARTRWDAQPDALAMRQHSVSNAVAFPVRMLAETSQAKPIQDELRPARENGSDLKITLEDDEVKTTRLRHILADPAEPDTKKQLARWELDRIGAA